MAIAPLPDLEVEPGLDLDDVPWPRPALRLVERAPEAVPAECHPTEIHRHRANHPSAWPRTAWVHPAGSALVDEPVTGSSDLAIVWDVGRRPAAEGEGLLRPAGLDGPAYRPGRVSARVRRRRLALGALVAVVLVALALPVSALGGRSAPATPAVVTPAAAAVATPVGATVYTVRPGDTLWSIASKIDGGGDPRPLAAALAARLGSTTVVPGERIAIP
ncbi:MAG TPA: LysM domain-containing protein [Acidimicrobiales bacterium]